MDISRSVEVALKRFSLVSSSTVESTGRVLFGGTTLITLFMSNASSGLMIVNFILPLHKNWPQKRQTQLHPQGGRMENSIQKNSSMKTEK
jgi:hypothetical protein